MGNRYGAINNTCEGTKKEPSTAAGLPTAGECSLYHAVEPINRGLKRKSLRR